MNLNNKHYKNIIYDDWVYRRIIKSDRDTVCDMCGKDINAGDPLCFVSEENYTGKLCPVCQNRIVEYLKYILDGGKYK